MLDNVARARTYIKKSNPIQYFAEWFVEKDLENWISKEDLYNEYVNLCMELEKTPAASNIFSKEVRRFLPYIMEYRKSFEDSKGKKRRVQGWKGIRVLTEKINKQSFDPESAFQNQCFGCGAILHNEWYEHDKKRFCRKCHQNLGARKKKTKCKNFRLKEDQPFCEWLQSFLADSKKCNSSECDGFEEASE
jgi:hypothetical protein